MQLGNGPTGIIDVNTLESVVYPNPADNEFTILTTEKGAIKYSLANSLGQVLISNEDKMDLNNKIQVNTNYLAPGFYYLKLEQNGKKSIHKISIVR